jgi:hypothetical protein
VTVFELWIVKLPNQPMDHVLVIKITVCCLKCLKKNKNR